MGNKAFVFICVDGPSDVDAVRAMIYASLEMFNQFCPIVAVSPMPLDRSYVDLPKSTKSVF